MFVSLYVWLHKLWRHGLDGMPEFIELSRPVVRTATGFYTNQAGL